MLIFFDRGPVVRGSAGEAEKADIPLAMTGGYSDAAIRAAAKARGSM